MAAARTLSLKREALQELTTAELAGVAGGAQTEWSCHSCMTYVSCYMTDCVTRLSVPDCID